MEILRGYNPYHISFFLLPIASLIIIYLYCSYKLNYWKRRGVLQLSSTNKIFRDVKNGILFRIPPGYHLGDIYRATPSDAPYVGFYIFHKPCLLLKDPEIIKQVFIRDFDKFPNRHFAGEQQKDSTGMINLFGLRNPAWRYVRRKITPTLGRSSVKQILTLMMESGEPMMAYLKKRVGNDNKAIVDAQDMNHKYAADLIANVALGTKTDSFNNPNSNYTKCLLDFFHSFKRMVALVTVFFMPELVDIIGDPMFFDSSFVRKIFWSALEDRQKFGGRRGDYIDSIIDLKNGDQNPVYKFEGDYLLSQSGMFFSGFESSSSVSAFTLMELAKHKAYQGQARVDIKDAIDKHGWTIQAFDNMKYLGQCIAEGVRLHPSASILDRYTIQDYKIPNSDVVIEKGTPIFISLYGLHGDPQYFDEPELFNPERFSNGRTISDAYLPFGTGPRKCIGMKIGELYIKVMLSMILCEYEVYLGPAEEIKLDSRSTFTAAADGINIEFTRIIK